MLHQKMLNEDNPVGRIFSSVMDPDKVMVILTASRNNNTDEENEKNNADLRETLIKYGFGYRKAEGHYPEEHEGEKIDRIDDPTFVITSCESGSDIFKLSCCLCRKYEQECFLYKNHDGYVSLVDPEGNEIKDLGMFHPDRVSEYMTIVKKKPFVYDSVSEYISATPVSYTDALLIRSRRKALENS